MASHERLQKSEWREISEASATDVQIMAESTKIKHSLPTVLNLWDKNKTPLDQELEIQNKKKSILHYLEKGIDDILRNN